MAEPLFSFGGLASGIDTQAIISALVGVRRRPIQQLEARKTSFEQLRTRYKSLESRLDKLKDAADEIKRSQDFLSFGATSSNTSVLTAAASGAAATGSFDVVVSALARAESEGSTGFADFDTTSLGTGTLKITLAGTEHDVVIAAGEDTLEGIRDAINDAAIGVTATIVNTGSGATPYRLVVTADATGAANTISFSDDLGGGGLAATLAFTNLQAASDATVSINNLTVSRSTNRIDDVVPGVTLDLLATGSTTVTVESDADAIRAKLQKYVSAHNDVMSFIDAEIKISTTTNKGGVFNGEATARAVKSRILQQYALSSYPGGSFATLAQVGLSLNKDGTLAFDAAKFDAAVDDDLAGLAALFTTVGDRVDGSGFSLLEVPDVVAAGDYAVSITQAATKAATQAGQAFDPAGLAAAETLTLTAGSTVVEVPLLAGDSLADAVTKINAALDAAGVRVTARDEGGTLAFKADDYGSAGSFQVVSDTAAGAGTSGVGTTPLVAAGLDVAGTIGGQAASGAGQVLTGAAGTDFAGVRLRFSGTAPASGDLTVGPDGFFVKMEGLLDDLLAPVNGSVDARIDSLDDTIADIVKRIRSQEDRVEQYREGLSRRFAALEGLIGRLQSEQSFLATYQFPGLASRR